MRLAWTAFTLTAALSLGAGPMLRSVHFIVVEHTWCPEHQAFAHLDDAHQTSGDAESTPTEPTAPFANLLAANDTHADLVHAGCAGHLLPPNRLAVLPIPPAVAAAATAALRQVVAIEIAPTPAAIYREAPKQSPPA